MSKPLTPAPHSRFVGWTEEELTGLLTAALNDQADYHYRSYAIDHVRDYMNELRFRIDADRH